ncbi:DUF2157 domain-containing protein [Polymorphum gilvum]|uniref:DUF2157 domain-containing protein n=1 Tax=Polymorphum gilvum (strain LMG 25793 / CGMCC 1.9160 / SL003B-26A1) TaxID=991905 RepID=F2IWA3_POLGS|nr:DUF2157 domain-containing protein [Polymorphum gilvum]ADZ71488.1 hypothetical protein SL003B_3065 [Polymorphum gilvum SL003B-26A1]
MFDQIYARRLKADMETWVANGWVAPEGATRILASLAAGDGRSRLPMALAGIGVVCMALALAAFIAANWDAIPRALKLAGIALAVLLSHGAAAWAADAGRRGIADLATAFATLVFVGGLALVGQIFHLPQDWAGGALLVCLGAIAAAWLAGSRAALVVAAVAAIQWQTMRSELGAETLVEGLIGFALLAAVLAHPLVHPARLSRWAALSLLYVTFGRWIVEGADRLDDAALAAALLGFAALSAALVVFGALLERRPRDGRASVFAGPGLLLLARSAQELAMAVLLLAVVVALVGISEIGEASLGTALAAPAVALLLVAAVLGSGMLLAAGAREARHRLTVGAVAACLAAVLVSLAAPQAMIPAAALALGATVAVSMAGILAHVSAWTLGGHIALTVVVLWLLSVTIGTLLGQAVFFLVAGLVLIAMALVTARSLRRAAARRQEDVS